jgi:hypothetical protein
MPLTANRELSRYVDQELRSFPVAAATHIYKGMIVGVERATGFVRPLVAGDLFAGIAYEEMDNSAGAAGAMAARLYTQGDFVLTVNSATAAWTGAAVYASNDDVTSVLNALGGSYCGILMGMVGSGVGIVRIRSLAMPQVEHSCSVPLVSSTSAATVNGVLIAPRAIKLMSAQVSFNTVPNSGNLDVGTGNTNPTELVNGFNLATLTAHVPANLTLFGRDVAKNLRVWARVGIATTTAGVGGVLTLRYFELP